MEYVIIGDTEKHKDCLVYVCGKDKEKAEETLNRVLNNPTENDLAVSKGHFNLRIETVEDRYCWWNDPFLCN